MYSRCMSIRYTRRKFDPQQSSTSTAKCLYFYLPYETRSLGGVFRCDTVNVSQTHTTILYFNSTNTCVSLFYNLFIVVGNFEFCRLVVSWSLTRRSDLVWAEMNLMRVFWPHSRTILIFPSQLEDGPLSWTTWLLKTCWVANSFVSSCLQLW